MSPKNSIKPPVPEKIPKSVQFGKVKGQVRGSDKHVLMNPPKELIDHYNWMRNKKLAKPYIEKEDEYTEKLMSPYADLTKQLYNEFLALYREDYESFKYPIKKDSPYLYNNRYIKDVTYPLFQRHNTLTNETIVLLDENELAKGHEHCDVTGIDCSPNEQYLSYGIDYDGDELYELRIVDLSTNEIIGRIPDLIYCSFEWANNQIIYYMKGNDANNLTMLYMYDLQTKVSTLVYEETTVEDYSLDISLSMDEEYLIVEIGNYDFHKIYTIALKTGNKEDLIVLTPLVYCAEEKDVEYDVDHSHNAFYVLTNKENAKNFKIVKLTNTGEVIEEFIPPSNDRYLDDFQLFQQFFVFTTKINGYTFVNLMDYERKEVVIINYYEPERRMSFSDYLTYSYALSSHVYTIDIGPNYIFESNKLIIRYDTLTAEPRLIEYDVASLEKRVVYVKETPNYHEVNYQSERLWVAINSEKWPLGIPVSLVYNKTLSTPLKERPLYLYGYGSYGHTVEPDFDFKAVPLLDRGWVYAIAHVRGGGFLGYEWYQDGKLANKMNTFRDFISVAEYLKNHDYCREISISGRSAGGLLVGASVVLRPDLFKNVIADVPFVDVLNTMSDSTIPLTKEEWTQWGNPNVEEDFHRISEYCPYTNVKFAHYPNIYFTAGLNDPRVPYWEALKLLVKIREYKLDENVQLIKMITEGHFGSSSRYKALEERAKEYTFLLINF
jgi:oligopeptidase B